MLGISLDTVRRHIRKGKLQAVKVETRHGIMWKVSIPLTQCTPVGMPMQPEQNAASDLYIKSLLDRIKSLEDELAARRADVQQLYGLLAQKALPEDNKTRRTGSRMPSGASILTESSVKVFIAVKYCYRPRFRALQAAQRDGKVKLRL
jgi:hypothetical protein